MEFFWLFIFIYGIIFAFVCSYLAGQKGRDRFGWGVSGFFLGIIALLVLGFAPNSNKEYIECPMCAELIKKNAIKCKHCGENIDRGENIDPTVIVKKSEELEKYRAANGLCVNCGAQMGGIERLFNSYCTECKAPDWVKERRRNRK